MTVSALTQGQAIRSATAPTSWGVQSVLGLARMASNYLSVLAMKATILHLVSPSIGAVLAN